MTGIDNLLKILPEEVLAGGEANPGEILALLATAIVLLIIVAAIYILIYLGIVKLNHRIFLKIEKKKGASIKFQFMEKLINTIAFIVILIIPFAGDKIGHTILGSTAVLAAIAGFAGQDVIKDILSGLLISVYKPFDIGDRIELDDGTIGVVENMTMRHVVIVPIDTLRVVIPNSKINGMSIINYSYGYVSRSLHFKFPVSYDVDILKTKKVISEAIQESEYSRPDKKYKDGKIDYAPVYFIEIADSALIMSTTVYFDSRIPSEIVKDDIHTRVFEALEENNIEIPYNNMTLRVPDTVKLIEEAGA